MQLRTDEKPGKVGGKFPDFHFYRLNGEIIHKDRLVVGIL